MRTMRDILNGGDSALGTVIQSGSEAVVEGFGCAGFDFVILDMEHGSQDIAKIESLARAAEVRDLPKMVRVWGGDKSIVAKAVDIGAQGLVFPSVDSREEAEELVSWAKLPPYGNRGVCPVTRSGDYFKMPLNTYTKRTNDVVIVVYIETEEGMSNLTDIVSVPGIDVVMVGSLDLAVSMQLDMEVWPPPEIEVAKGQVADAAKAANVVLMEFVTSDGEIADSFGRGAQLVLYGTDTSIVTDACSDIVASYQGVVGN